MVVHSYQQLGDRTKTARLKVEYDGFDTQSRRVEYDNNDDDSCQMSR
jgi:hypothetical protein